MLRKTLIVVLTSAFVCGCVTGPVRSALIGRGKSAAVEWTAESPWYFSPLTSVGGAVTDVAVVPADTIVKIVDNGFVRPIGDLRQACKKDNKAGIPESLVGYGAVAAAVFPVVGWVVGGGMMVAGYSGLVVKDVWNDGVHDTIWGDAQIQRDVRNRQRVEAEIRDKMHHEDQLRLRYLQAACRNESLPLPDGNEKEAGADWNQTEEAACRVLSLSPSSDVMEYIAWNSHYDGVKVAAIGRIEDEEVCAKIAQSEKFSEEARLVASEKVHTEALAQKIVNECSNEAVLQKLIPCCKDAEFSRQLILSGRYSEIVCSNALENVMLERALQEIVRACQHETIRLAALKRCNVDEVVLQEIVEKCQLEPLRLVALERCRNEAFAAKVVLADWANQSLRRIAVKNVRRVELLEQIVNRCNDPMVLGVAFLGIHDEQLLVDGLLKSDVCDECKQLMADRLTNSVQIARLLASADDVGWISEGLSRRIIYDEDRMRVYNNTKVDRYKWVVAARLQDVSQIEYLVSNNIPHDVQIDMITKEPFATNNTPRAVKLNIIAKTANYKLLKWIVEHGDLKCAEAAIHRFNGRPELVDVAFACEVRDCSGGLFRDHLGEIAKELLDAEGLRALEKKKWIVKRAEMAKDIQRAAKFLVGVDAAEYRRLKKWYNGQLEYNALTDVTIPSMYWSNTDTYVMALSDGRATLEFYYNVGTGEITYPRSLAFGYARDLIMARIKIYEYERRQRFDSGM